MKPTNPKLGTPIDPEQIPTLLQHISFSWKPEKLIPFLDFLLAHPESAFSVTILDFIRNLKDPAVSVTIASFVSKTDEESCLIPLISACWENGLDYSPYLDIFLTKALAGSYAVALEVMTLIENHVTELDPDQKQSLQAIISQQWQSQTMEKSVLIGEILKILQ